MTNKQHPVQFDWATELSDAQGHVTLSAQEANEISARLRSMGEKLKVYEDLDEAASDVQLLRMGYAAARLEIQSLQARIKTMAEEHADELMVAHLDGRMRGRSTEPAGEYPALPKPFCSAHDDADSEWPDMFSARQMRAFADATCAMRAAQPDRDKGCSAMTQDTNTASGAAIKRYKIGYHTDEWGVRSSTPGGITDPSGQWVLYKDHLAAMESHVQAPAQAAPAAVAVPIMTRHRTKDEILHFLTKEQMVEEIIRLDAALAAAPTTQPAPQPSPASQGDSLDAARYRFLAAHCRSTSEHWGGRWSIIVDGPAPKSHDSEDDFDVAVDAARAAQEDKSHGLKT